MTNKPDAPDKPIISACGDSDAPDGTADRISSRVAAKPKPAEANPVLTMLFHKHHAELRNMLRKLFGDGPPEPEDIIQAAFSEMAKLGESHHIEHPKAYLFRASVNIGWRFLKRQTLLREYLETHEHFFGDEMEEISPERLLESREALDTVNKAMQSLSPRQREIIVRSRLKGETYDQISNATGWSPAVISRDLNAALKILSTAVGRDAKEPKP